MINTDDLKNDRVIWREETFLKPIKIPEGSIKCPDCKGTGEILFMYCDPGPNKYWQCITCLGEGYLKKEDLESWKNRCKKKRDSNMSELDNKGEKQNVV